MLSSSKIGAVFALSGFLSGILIVPLALLWMPFVFTSEGVLFALGFGVAYLSCRRILPRIGPLRFWGALLALAIGYPVAIGFGGALSLASEFMLQGAMKMTPALQDAGPLMILAFMLLWGSLAAALFIQMALVLITAEWDNRILLWLAIAAVGTAVLSTVIYSFFYNSADPTITHYREFALFGVLAPVGNAALNAVCAQAILRAHRAELALAAARQF